MILEEWDPIEDIIGRFYLEGLHDDYEGFRLLLRSENNNKVLRIHFDSILAYQNIDEGDLLKSLQEGKIKGGFFKIEGSSYLDWFHEQSLGVRKDENIFHYGIYTPNDTVDILSLSIPKVEWLN